MEGRATERKPARGSAGDDRTIASVARNGLCTGCGTCAGVCPRDAVDMVIDHRRGIYVPRLDEGKCNECGLCFAVCPGHSVDFRQLNIDIFGREPGDILLGNYLNCYTGHATDYDIRYNSASGGLVTALLIFALEEGLIDGALVTRMRKDRPLEPEPFIARTKEEIVSASRSKYCPVPANAALKEILKAKDGERFAVVGLPCHLHGIRKAEGVNRKLKEKAVLHFGLLCAHTDRLSGTGFILHERGIKEKAVARLDYRGRGWPGAMTILLRDGTQRVVPFEEYIRLHELHFFTPGRCLLCCDAIARLADITFMDAWLPEVKAKDRVGTSIVVSRTGMCEALCRSARAKHAIALERIGCSDVIRSQGRARIANKDLRAQYRLSRLCGGPTPDYRIVIPRSGAVNYLRASVARLNMWVSSKACLRRFVSPMVSAESRIFGRVRSKV